ncbi:hypothetical protein SAMN05216228_1002319 [Rhizobium tibeticum]|uniref:Uncharacterized protein n=1 Tax=Rhizobium tibeticum TaxID=501024 RepID=A0A1H8E662_9HYPH|nr:hypothetical protein RTCCBAU85039_1139 [Rhizobium tibeticum]SEN14955.1 hypothetical protein SAMN05216228_1002319 [Rhizobium tibeticum]
MQPGLGYLLFPLAYTWLLRWLDVHIQNRFIILDQPNDWWDNEIIKG